MGGLKKRAVLLVLCLALLCPAVQAMETSACTPLSEDAAIRHNVSLAAEKVDGVYLQTGEQFSCNSLVGDRTVENGFVEATNGRGVQVVGGGFAQVATTLYMALIGRDDVAYDSIRTYNELFTGSYVDSGYDAVLVDWQNEIDFSFTSWCPDALAISMCVEEDALFCRVSAAEKESRRRVSSAALAISGGDAALTARTAAEHIHGAQVAPGEVFSFLDTLHMHSVRVSATESGMTLVAMLLNEAVSSLPSVTVVEKHEAEGILEDTMVENFPKLI